MLQERGAGEIPHPGDVLLLHLRRVEERLRGHGADDVLCRAALAHAVYGTDGLDVQLLTLDEREVLADLAGEEAEQLVYLYAACDRRRTWSGLAATRQVHDRWTGAVITPEPAVLARFVDLSIVNELDVMEHAPHIKAKDGVRLLGIYRSWEGFGSRQVSRDAYRVLGLDERGRRSPSGQGAKGADGGAR